MKFLILISLLILAATCYKENDFVQCPKVRTQACYRIYKPVCGKVISKHLNIESMRQYSNDCVACSNQEVTGYFRGPCEKEEKPKNNEQVGKQPRNNARFDQKPRSADSQQKKPQNSPQNEQEKPKRKEFLEKEKRDNVNEEFFKKSGFKNSETQQEQKKKSPFTSTPKFADDDRERCEDMKNLKCDKNSPSVCGYFDQSVRCFVPPCAAEFPNKCQACLKNTVEFVKEGKCPGFDGMKFEQVDNQKKQIKTNSFIENDRNETNPFKKEETSLDKRMKNKKLCPKYKNKKACPLNLEPVCGLFSQTIKCFAPPCGQTFGNACQACAAENVEYTIDGPCI